MFITILFSFLLVIGDVVNLQFLKFLFLPPFLLSSFFNFRILYAVFHIRFHLLYFVGAPNGVQSFELFASGEWRTDFDAIYQKLIQSATFAEIVAGLCCVK